MSREPVYDRFGVTVYHGDNLGILREMAAASVDAVVTDPPAGIEFLGREWDGGRGGREQWVAWLQVRMAEALRVLKPGGHALVWAMPRTSHWTAWALEDAGFEVRDAVQHEFENGMPKSLDVSKAIDRSRDDRPAILHVTRFVRAARDRARLRNADVDAVLGVSAMCDHWCRSAPLQALVPTVEQWEQLRALLGFDESMDAEVWRLNGRKGTPGEAWDQREVIGQRVTGIGTGRGAVAIMGDSANRDVTSAATDLSRQWEGWGTGLRPAAEPWWLCRKPFAQTVAANVLEHATGALNIDATRGPDGQWPANVAKFPKAPPSERPMVNGEQHPTVKSVALCRWLVRLVTPPDGVVLDLFAGTGPVGQAARAEGKRAILIEEDGQSIGFIRARLDARPRTEAPIDPGMEPASADDHVHDLLDLLGDAS